MGKHEADSGMDRRPRKKTKKGKKRTGLLVLVAILAAVACFVTWFLTNRPSQNAVGKPGDRQEQPGQQDDPAQPDDPQPVDPKPAADDPKEPDNAENTEPEKKMKEGVYTILLAGTFDDYNTDTLILCRVDTNTDQVNMVSINRDSQVETKINNKRINCIYGYAGIEDMCQAVTDITGVPVNYYVVINGKSFVDMIDLIGGVEYTVPYHMYHGDKDPNSHIDLSAGTYTLTGWQAQQYVRFRSTKESDFGRVNRQKEFLVEVLRQVKNKFSLSQVKDYIGIFNENVETNMNVQNMVWFYLNVLNEMDFSKDILTATLPYDHTGRYTHPGHGAAAYVYLNEAQVAEFVNENLNPYTTDISAKDITVGHYEDK